MKSHLLLSAVLVLAGNATSRAQLWDVTQPGDPIVPTSFNTPVSEQVANAIDNQPTKYLNFDKLNTGLTVSPRIGATIVSGLGLTSANDRPDGDPASYMLSGSLDGTNFTEISSGNVAPFTARFQRQEILFSNETAYAQYRLIFPTVVDPVVAVAMHIAEVELLTSRDPPGPTNCLTLIQRQPVDTPVLEGARATFRVFLTGPWRVQWYRNGEEIPGATASTYTIGSATAKDDGARFRVRVTGMAAGTPCLQESDEVMLSIFTPSATESVGLNWVGQGAASGPTYMFPEDITGLFLQAYWNNLAGSTGSVTRPTNSSNLPYPTITVQWATSGEWRVGAGEEDPAQRMFDGFCASYGTNDQTAQTVTFSGLPRGRHSVLLYTVQVPLEFFHMDFQVLTFHSDGTPKPIVRRFIRPQNSDEYNPRPEFVLVNSDHPATRAVGNTMWINNLQPEDGRIQIRFFSPGRTNRNASGDPTRGPGLNGMQLLLNPIVLSIGIVSSNEILLSWPAAGKDFTLESTEKLSPLDWQPVPATPTLREDRLEVNLPINKPQQYFRLRQ